MHLKYLSVARLIELDNFDHFLLEGQIPENLDVVTSIVPMQIISKDIVIIDLYSDIQDINKLIECIVTPYDRIWLYNKNHDDFQMTNVQDLVNN